LHFALPVARLSSLHGAQGLGPDSFQRSAAAGSRWERQPSRELLVGSNRALLAFDPGGDGFDPRGVPARAILAFGSERRGISAELLGRAEMSLRLPMREGVSSINLASAVAAVLYSLRLH
jgi:TrmH family RNA methyltransferase